MIKWPERAKGAIKKLFEPLQDIDVYVEDHNDEVFYTTLLKRVAEDRIRIARVFALDGRESVIKAAIAHDNAIRKALFVIDGDLDWVLGDPAPHIVGLHRHEAYCIENMLLCDKALSQILSEDIVITEDEAAIKLDFNNWRNSIQNPLLELFSSFAIAKKFIPEQKTVSSRVGKMCIQQKNITVLDPSKVLQAKKQVLTAVEAIVDKSTAILAYEKVLARLKELPFPLHAVSGKDYLFPLLHFLMASLGCRITTKSLRIRLAKNGDINRFAGLRDAIFRAV